MFDNNPAGSQTADRERNRNRDQVHGGRKKMIGNLFEPLRDVRVLASAGLLAAISIVLGFFKIPITQLIELRCAFIPIAVAAYLYGPVIGGAVGLISDIGGYLVKPTGPFFPGFTVTAVVTGVLFGCLLYRHRPTLTRILVSQIVYAILCGLLLNSLWLSILYGNGFLPVVTARFVKELVMIPVNTAALMAVLTPVTRFRAVAQ